MITCFDLFSLHTLLLNIHPVENKLHNVHTDIMKLGKEIIKTTSERPVEKTPVLKKSVMIAVEDLLKELEVAHVKKQRLGL